jgi:hypothetical protein
VAEDTAPVWRAEAAHGGSVELYPDGERAVLISAGRHYGHQHAVWIEADDFEELARAYIHYLSGDPAAPAQVPRPEDEARSLLREMSPEELRALWHYLTRSLRLVEEIGKEKSG